MIAGPCPDLPYSGVPLDNQRVRHLARSRSNCSNPRFMISKATTPGHEMTWVLFENADASMMLVKKRNNGPKRKPAARNLQQQEENNPPGAPLPPSVPANDNYQEAPRAEVQTQTTPPPFEAPPPYSPRHDCACHNGLSKPPITPAPPPAARIPPPLPPRPPVPAQQPVKSSTSLQLGKSCPDLARLVAKSVQNVKESMNQDQEKRALARTIQSEKKNMVLEQEKKAAARSMRKTDESYDRESDSKLVSKPVQKVKDNQDGDYGKTTNPKSYDCFADRVSQEHGTQALARATQNVANNMDHDYEKKGRRDSPPSPQSALEELISTKLDAVLTSIDGEAFSGNEKELGTAFAVTCSHMTI